MAQIHQTAIIGNDVELADSVFVGPYCIIEDHVKIGENTRLIAQCHIYSNTTIGAGNTIFPFASLGGAPNDISYDPSQGDSFTRIGDDNIIREGVSIHRGAHPGTETVVGSHGFFMGNAHMAHNTVIGDHVIMALGVLAAGYVQIGDRAFISGNVCIHQFVRVGRFAMISGGSAISMDLPPFMIGDGRNGGVRSFNKVALERAGYSREDIRTIHKMYDIAFRRGLNMKNALEEIETTLPQIPEVKEFVEFVRSAKRGVLSGGSTRRA